jgi:hypothetical protein
MWLRLSQGGTGMNWKQYKELKMKSYGHNPRKVYEDGFDAGWHQGYTDAKGLELARVYDVIRLQYGGRGKKETAVADDIIELIIKEVNG